MSAPASPTTRSTHRDEVDFVLTDDGTIITLIRVRGVAAPTRGPVLLAHGAGMRAESFRPPAIRSIVDVLVDDGWDVWMLNWRGSIDLPAVPWTIDDVALYDIPAAVRHVTGVTGSGTVKVIGHCQGAAALSVAAAAGLVPEVDVVVANSVSLHPVLPFFARVKLDVLLPMFRTGEPYVDIAWGDGPEKGVARLTRNAVRLGHPECRNPGCNMASFALGSGHPAVWRHENLDSATHDWLEHEFGKIPLSWYAQMTLSQRAGRYVMVRGYEALPHRVADAPPQTDARFALLTGDENRAFLPASQHRTHAYLEAVQPGKHSLTEIPGYGHADVFVGRRAHVDAFPYIRYALGR